MMRLSKERGGINGREEEERRGGKEREGKGGEGRGEEGKRGEEREGMPEWLKMPTPLSEEWSWNSSTHVGSSHPPLSPGRCAHPSTCSHTDKCTCKWEKEWGEKGSEEEVSSKEGIKRRKRGDKLWVNG